MSSGMVAISIFEIHIAPCTDMMVERALEKASLCAIHVKFD